MVDLPHLAERSLLLLIADRKEHEPFTVEKALGGPPELRRALAVALGRSGHPGGFPVLRGLTADDDVEVRRAAAFALGLARDPAAVPALLELAAGAGRPEAVLAVEALGKLEAPLVEVLQALTPLAENERWARLLPHLWRFSGDTVVPLALAGLGQEDRELRAGAAFALASRAPSAPRPEVAAALSALLADPEPRVRGWAALGLGSVGGEEDLPRLEALLANRETGPVVEALRAARDLVLAGRAAPPAAWRPRLLASLDDPRPAVRALALEVAGAWLPDATLGERLQARFERGRGRERELALVALAQGDGPRAGELAAVAAQAPEPALRRAAVEAAALLEIHSLLARLSGDPAPAVRAPALTARLGLAGGADAEADRTGLLATGLGDDDPGVRAAVLTWLASHPILPFEGITASVRLALRDPDPGGRLAGVAALVARGKAEPLERGSVVRDLEALAAERDYLLRRAAVAALGALGRPEPAVGSVATGRGGDVYREIVQRTSRPRSVEVQTARGVLHLRLACPAAPLTCLSFLQLAAQGFYDGLAFHRVEPGRFAQAGDPRSRDSAGDGWGGPGYTLRDEIGLLPARRGILAMAASEPDAAGSQFLILLSDQPQLDGKLTVFGEVVGGWEVLDAIEQGDRVEGLRERP